MYIIQDCMNGSQTEENLESFIVQQGSPRGSVEEKAIDTQSKRISSLLQLFPEKFPVEQIKIYLAMISKASTELKELYDKYKNNQEGYNGIQAMLNQRVKEIELIELMDKAEDQKESYLAELEMIKKLQDMIG